MRKQEQEIEMPCIHCGALVTRNPSIRIAACYDCKRKRKEARALLQRRGVTAPRSEYSKKISQMREAKARKIKRKKEARLKKRRERELRWTEMKLDGMTLEAIAAQERPQVTHQRVRQVLNAISKREGITFPRQHRYGIRGVPRIETVCAKEGCDKTIKIQQKNFKGHGKHFCCSEHRSHYFHPDGTRMTKREIARWQYYNLPGRKERVSQATRRYHLRKMAEKGDYYRHFLGYQKAYYKKKMQADPDYRARVHRRIREHYETHKKRMKEDSVYAEAFRERQREYDRRRREKRRNPQPERKNGSNAV